MFKLTSELDCFWWTSPWLCKGSKPGSFKLQKQLDTIWATGDMHFFWSDCYLLMVRRVGHSIWTLLDNFSQYRWSCDNDVTYHADKDVTMILSLCDVAVRTWPASCCSGLVIGREGRTCAHRITDITQVSVPSPVLQCRGELNQCIFTFCT